MSLVAAGSSRVGCPCTPSDCPEVTTLVPSNVVVAANSLLTRASSALTASNSVALSAPCRSNAPMVASLSRLSLDQLARLVSFSLVRAATCSRSSTPSAHSLASSIWDKPSASLSSATLFLNSLIESLAASLSHASCATWRSLLALLATAASLALTICDLYSSICSLASRSLSSSRPKSSRISTWRSLDWSLDSCSCSVTLNVLRRATSQASVILSRSATMHIRLLTDQAHPSYSA